MPPATITWLRYHSHSLMRRTGREEIGFLPAHQPASLHFMLLGFIYVGNLFIDTRKHSNAACYLTIRYDSSVHSLQATVMIFALSVIPYKQRRWVIH